MAGDPSRQMAVPPLEPGAPATPTLEAQGAISEARDKIQALIGELYKMVPVIGQYGDAQEKSSLLKSISQLQISFHSSAPSPPSPAMEAAISRGVPPPQGQAPPPPAQQPPPVQPGVQQ